MKYSYVLLITIMIFGVARCAHADVVINEIAWMGTTTSANDEWIELYNSGSDSVTLDGWTLNASDGSPSIDLVGTINAGGYYLAERTDDATVPGITAGVIYSGSLSNTGETLLLKNNNEVTVDTVNMSGGWTAGDSTTKNTMQKSGGVWITGTPTPGVVNVSNSSNSGSGSSGSTSGSGSNTQTTSATTTVTKPKTEQEYWQDYVKQLDPDPKYSARMIVPDIVVEHVPVKFSAVVKKFDLITVLEGKYEWSMGDGQSYVFRENKPITYTYQQPGEYVVMMKYYSNVFKEEADSLHQKTITVIPALVKTVVDIPTGNITLTNMSTGDIDLYQWKLQAFTGSSFTFLTSTILRKDSSITITPRVHQLPYVSNKGIQLLTPDGYRVPNSGVASTTTQPLSLSHTSYSTLENTANSFIENSNQEISNEDSGESLYEVPQTTSVSPFANKPFSSSLPLVSIFIVATLGATFGFHKISSISSDHKT